jgi:uncharacterized membrane protein YdbT with pleckstrin-like domain
MKSINTVIEFFLISQILKIEPVKIKTAEVAEDEGGIVLRILFHTSIKHERKHKESQQIKQPNGTTLNETTAQNTLHY